MLRSGLWTTHETEQRKPSTLYNVPETSSPKTFLVNRQL